MRQQFLKSLFIVMGVIGFDSSLLADETWQGPGGGNWFTAGNWSPAVVPGPGDLALFITGAGSPAVVSTSPPAAASVLGIQYANTNTTAYTIQITTLTNTSEGSLIVGASGINNQSSVLQLFSMDIGTSAIPNMFTVNGGAFVGPIQLNVNSQLGTGHQNLVNFNSGTSTGSLLCNISGGQAAAVVTYNNTSTAATSTFNISTTASTAELLFTDSSTAGTAQINLLGNFNSVLRTESGASLQNAVINNSGGLVDLTNTNGGGNATLVLTNSGILEIEADNTLGSLSSDASSTVNLNSFALQAGSLGTSTTVAGAMTGAGGSFIKVGAGTTTFSGTGKTYSGPTTVNGGTLLLNTSIAGDAIVNSGGTLAGVGPVGGNGTINSGGIISPGNNSIDTLTFNGNYTQNPGSFYFDNIAGTNQSDLINVAGAATLNGGTVQVISGTPLPGDMYHILHATGGVSGTFSSLVLASGASTMKAGLVYQPFDVFIETLGTNFVPFARTSNQRHVARQFDSLTSFTPDELLVIDALGGLTIPQLQHALDLMSGEQYANLIQSQQEITRRFIRRLYDPLRELLTGCLCCPPRCGCEYGIGPWLQVEGGRSFLQGDRNGKGFKDHYYDVSFGAQSVFEGCCDYTWIIGVAGDYSRDYIDYNLRGHSRLRTWQGAIYGAFMHPDFYVLADLVGGETGCRMKRGIAFGTIDRHARGHPNMSNVTGYAELGYNFCGCNFLVQPFVAFESGKYWRDHAHEHGAESLNLSIKKAELTSFDSRLGFHITSCFCEEFFSRFCRQFVLGIDLAWQHRFNSVGGTLHTRFIDFGNAFSIHGPRQGRDGVDAALYLGAEVSEWLTFFAEFGGEKWGHYSTWNVTGGLEGRF